MTYLSQRVSRVRSVRFSFGKTRQLSNHEKYISREAPALANSDGNKFKGDNNWYFLRIMNLWPLLKVGKCWKSILHTKYFIRIRIYIYTHISNFIQVYHAAWHSMQNGDVLRPRYRATYQQACNLATVLSECQSLRNEMTLLALLSLR